MFQFRAFPSYNYLIHCTIHRYCPCGFPHSEISGSSLICSSPKLIAACRVLHRLLMPRHSPCALISFTCCMISHNRFSELCRSQQKFSFRKIVSTLIKLKFSTLLLVCGHYDRALCCLAFLILFSVKFSRCILRGVPSKLNNARDRMPCGFRYRKG